MPDDTEYAMPTPEPDAPASATAEPAGAEASAPGPTPGEAWTEVIASMAELGDAIARWAKAAANEPDTKQKLDQVRCGVNDIARKADAALDQVRTSDFGQHVRGGAEQAGQTIGDAATQVSQAAAPHVRSAFAGLASAFGKAAERMDEAATSRAQAEPPGAATPPTTAPPTEAPDAATPPTAAPPAPPIPGDD